MLTSEGPEAVPPLVRGSVSRISAFKEMYQEGVIRAIAAASGVVISKPEVDEGIDLTLTHTSEVHTAVEKARLEVQLKATATEPTKTGFNVQIERTRYDMLRSSNPAVPKILIVMSIPRSQDDWIHMTDNRAKMRHAAYWVNLDGLPEVQAKMPTVTAPLSQRFDDRALCEIMVRIGAGGKP